MKLLIVEILDSQALHLWGFENHNLIIEENVDYLDGDKKTSMLLCYCQYGTVIIDEN